MSIITRNGQSDTIFLKAALAYAEQFSLPVFPIVAGTKRPLTSNGLYAATTDTEQIKAWWTQTPDAGIGIPCGPVSGLIVVDQDPRNGSEESIERLEYKDYEPLPDTAEVVTPSGGRHRYYRFDERVTRSKLENYPGIDLQGQGRYVCVPPSQHPNGGTYEWELSSHISDTPIATLPEFFIKLAQHSESGEVKARPKEHWVKLLQGVEDGGRNDALTSLTGHLLRKNVNVAVAYEIVSCWNEARNEPPIEEEEFDRTFNSVLQKEVQRVKRRNR